MNKYNNSLRFVNFQILGNYLPELTKINNLNLVLIICAKIIDFFKEL